MGMKSTGGEIVQVQGGHIVRSTGRKDRHSKVYTAKGPRDRRVRLSAHTAIQFYDVQDRLGYDRPSKAVDWLIKKAQSAIEKLAELPPWHPVPAADIENPPPQDQDQNEGGSAEIAMTEQSESSGYNNSFQLQENHHHHSAFIPSSIDTDAIAFFPTTSAASTINFQSYPPDNNSSEDLGLSLHSFHTPNSSNDHQTLFAGGSNTVVTGFEPNYQRIVAWNNNDSASGDMNRAGFMINSQPFLGSSSAFSQRGTLQSSFSPSIRNWNEIPMAKPQPMQQQQQASSIFGSRFLSDALQGFCIPARIQGEDERHGPSSSASPSSHH